MALTGTNLPEGMQLRRPRRPEEAVPRIGSNPHDAGKARAEVAKLHSAQQSREFPAERAHRCAVVGSRLHRHHQEDRGARERRRYRLWHSTRCGLRIKIHRMASQIGGRHLALGNGPRSVEGECWERKLAVAADERPCRLPRSHQVSDSHLKTNRYPGDMRNGAEVTAHATIRRYGGIARVSATAMEPASATTAVPPKRGVLRTRGCSRFTGRRGSSKSQNHIVSMTCEQDVSRDRDPKCVVADKGNRDEYPDNREPRENHGD